MSRLLSVAVVALLLALTAGCGSDEGFTGIEVPAGFIRTVNAIPDSPPLIVEIGTQSPQQLDFAQSSAFISSLPDLPLQMDVRYPELTDSVFIYREEPLLVERDEELTLVFAGTLDAPRILRVRNPPPTNIDITTELELQFVNTATRHTGPVTLQLYQEGAIVSESTLEFGESSALLRLTEGDYRVELRDAAGSLLWNSGTFALSAGLRPLVMVSDYFGPGGTNIRALRVTEQGTVPFPNELLPSALRVANMSASEGPLTITVRGETFEENVAFQTVTDYVTLDAGTASISVAPVGEPDNVLFESDSFGLLAGSYLTLVTAGTAEFPNARLFSDARRRVPVRARLNIVNASPTAGLTDIYVIDPGTSIEDQLPRLRLDVTPDASSAQSLALVEGGYDFVASDGGNKDIVAGPRGITLMGNGLYTFYLTDGAGGGSGAELVPADDFTP